MPRGTLRTRSHDIDGTGSYSKSVLSSETDALITRIIGCAIRVHSELGPGFLETIYASALEVEFAHEGIAFEREKPIVVRYRDEVIAGQRLDFVVNGQVILEIKAATKLRVGLLINFNVPLVKDGIKRIVV